MSGIEGHYWLISVTRNPFHPKFFHPTELFRGIGFIPRRLFGVWGQINYDRVECGELSIRVLSQISTHSPGGSAPPQTHNVNITVLLIFGEQLICSIWSPNASL